MDRILNTDETINLLSRHSFRELHLHHTWKPTHKDFNGKNHLKLQENMRRYHIDVNGWNDIGHHLCLMPDGKWVTGRDLNKDPASIKGWNKNALSIEMLGNFDKKGIGSSNSSGYDTLEGLQKDAVLKIINYFGNRFGYENIKFHREGPEVLKTCPGTSLNKKTLINKARALDKNNTHNNQREEKVMLIKEGNKGERVRKLQEDLIKLGYENHLKPYGADGHFGSVTKKCIEVFQKDHKLKIDGIAGNETLTKIKELLDNKNIDSSPGKNYKKLYDEAQDKLERIKEIVE